MSTAASNSSSRRWVVLLKAGALGAASIVVWLLHLVALFVKGSSRSRGSSGSDGSDG
ncbi:hypothetical protein G5C60_25160 [Streptomyces sp. HC44]|uniref:Uncharacterized protein n=1 Tax=Streptomyces scabichelini TaxID=2711217 RepID=A0A6G4VAF7_9ACTN|nr:hypothetical protein [Streptomyces scabichelini]NGO10793.1 hypothetical protein [Streptomyces scabichelini]